MKYRLFFRPQPKPKRAILNIGSTSSRYAALYSIVQCGTVLHCMQRGADPPKLRRKLKFSCNMRCWRDTGVTLEPFGVLFVLYHVFLISL